MTCRPALRRTAFTASDAVADGGMGRVGANHDNMLAWGVGPASAVDRYLMATFLAKLSVMAAM